VRLKLEAENASGDEDRKLIPNENSV